MVCMARHTRWRVVGTHPRWIDAWKMAHAIEAVHDIKELEFRVRGETVPTFCLHVRCSSSHGRPQSFVTQGKQCIVRRISSFFNGETDATAHGSDVCVRLAFLPPCDFLRAVTRPQQVRVPVD